METADYLTTTQVAELFQVRQKRVRQWIDDGQLRAVRTPGGRGTWRIPRVEVEKFLGVMSGKQDGAPT